MPHRVTILKRSTANNDMGQRKATWAVDVENVPCFSTPSGASASIRTQPTVEQSDYLTIYLPHDTDIQYTSRLRNIQTVSGDVIYSNDYQVIQIDKQISFTGKVQYLQITAKSVVE